MDPGVGSQTVHPAGRLCQADVQARQHGGEKYDVSCDWLLCGDLKGLQRMMRDHRERACGCRPGWEQIMEKYHRLPPEMQKIIEATVDRLLAERKR